MRKEVRRVPIDEGAVAYVMSLLSERDGLRVLNEHVIRTGELDEAAHTRLLDRYTESCQVYDMAFHEMVGQAAPDLTGRRYRHTLDMIRGELLIEEVTKC